jgi:hypothetical protein
VSDLPSQQLDELTAALEDTARRLRSGDLDADNAAGLVDDCARLAARAAGELEREARGLDAPPAQDSLL